MPLTEPGGTMDPYDTILELVKRAQTRGLETVTNRLDFVVESLEELIQEAKSSVQEAVPREPEELFPVAEVEAALGSLRDQAGAAEERAHGLSAEIADLQLRLDEALRVAEEAQRRPAEVVTVPSGGVTLELLRRLDRARSQSELLKELLPLLADCAGRAVVLVLRGTSLSAWSGIGFQESDHLRGWQGEVTGSDALDRFAREALPIRFAAASDPVLSRWLIGETSPSEAMLVPVSLRGKVMGGIYLDRLEARPWDPEQAQALIALTCWLIDTLSYRQTVPSPMLAEPIDLLGEVAEPAPEPRVEAEEEPFAAEEPAPEVAEEIEPTPLETVAAAVPSFVPSFVPAAAPALAEPEPEPEPEVQLEPEAAPAPSFDPTATVRVELREVAPVTPPAPLPEPEPVAPAVVEAPPQRALTPEEQAKHEEARRFARLLVSEIKLYNEEEVERGRTNRDLYHRLKDDVDRSREMYEKRIPAEIRAARDYFYEELLRILADGDPDALGM
jgi:hypothetical protein